MFKYFGKMFIYFKFLMCFSLSSVPMELDAFTLRNMGVNNLEASWTKPPGDVDLYMLTLLQDRCVYKETITVTSV